MGKPERNRQLGRTRRRWQDTIKTEFQEVGCEGIEWIQVAHKDRWRAIVSAVMDLWVPYNAGNYLIILMKATSLPSP